MNTQTKGRRPGNAPEDPGTPVRCFGVAKVAEWLAEENAKTGKPLVKPRDVTDWLHRYGPDRPPERLAVSPAYPAPDVEIEISADRVIQGWSAAKRVPWIAWYNGRPGRGAGGGRPRKAGTSA
jgi:hypothetical protein